jgi:hypothetical protein
MYIIEVEHTYIRVGGGAWGYIEGNFVCRQEFDILFLFNTGFFYDRQETPRD